jgi:hypothetical protein
MGRTMNETKEYSIADEYKQFVVTARKLAREDIVKYPQDKRDIMQGLNTEQHHFQKHLVGMITMFDSSYGTPEINKYILAWKQLKAYLLGVKATTALDYIAILEHEHKLEEYAEFVELSENANKKENE